MRTISPHQAAPAVEQPAHNLAAKRSPTRLILASLQAGDNACTFPQPQKNLRPALLDALRAAEGFPGAFDQ
jgi:hypothetical protein